MKRSPIIHRCEQGSAEWNALRCGRITAGRMADVLSYNDPSSAQAKAAGFNLVREAVAAGIRGPESAKRYNYRMDIVAERLTNMTEAERYRGKEVEWGNEWEPVARCAYEVATGEMVDQVGFIVHPTMDFFGGSPDALVGNDGGLELKCPKTTTHLEWTAAGTIPDEHLPQCAANLCISGRKWWDFASYDPRLPEDLRLFIVRMYRDEEALARIEAEVARFNAEVENAISNLRERKKAA